MQEKVIKTVIKNGITLTENITDRFKKKSISVYFILPSCREKIAAYLLIPKLLSTCCNKYPDIVSMNNMLAMNYGTRLSGSAYMSGDNIVMSIHVTFIGNEYAPNGENVLETAVDTLLFSIFDPCVSENGFDQSFFDNVRRTICESISSKIDNKQKYSITRLKEIMCDGEPFGMGDRFLLEQLSNTNEKLVYDVYKEVLNTARIEIITVGSKLDKTSVNKFYSYFKNGDLNINHELKSIIKTAQIPHKLVCDKMKVTQGQLVIGYRSLVNRDSSCFFATKIMSDILGGGTYSLLFGNVREKMGLCYYCNAGFFAAKGILVITSGVDFDKIDNAKKAIFDQFAAIKKGDFSDELLIDSKRSFENEIKAVRDTPGSIENWCIRSMTEIPQCTPEEYIESINAVTKLDVVNAAKEFDLDTVYTIMTED